MFREIGFKKVTDRCRLVYSQPSLKEYELQKQIRIIFESDETSLTSFDCLDIPSQCKDLYEQDSLFARRWQYFFGPRLQAACIGDFSKLCSLFPGHSIAGPRRNTLPSSIRYRGSLFFEQFSHLLSFDEAMLNVDDSSIQLKPIGHHSRWLWRFIDRPVLQYIEQMGQYPNGSYIDPNLFLNNLDKRLMESLRRNESVEKLLAMVHTAWTTTRVPDYDRNSLAACSEILEQVLKTRKPQILPLLFELEAFASYMTYARALNIFASGVFANNWVEVGIMPLSHLRTTELCIPERLFDELFNLSSRGFAPIVINEHGTIADGNHRLNSVWIWNILRYCVDCYWSLDNEQFQQRVAQFVLSNTTGIGPVSVHEALQHLSEFLLTPHYQKRLISDLKPIVQRNQAISELPVVLVPEYISSAVIKELYDEGLATIRVQPRLFEIMQKVPTAVLKPRTSYHFADCAMLPWFSILPYASEHCNLTWPPLRPAMAGYL